MIRPHHFFLNGEDEIYFLREYTSRESYAYSDTNQLIHNFKKPVAKKETPEWAHKQEAISSAAHQMRMAILQSKELGQRFQSATLVPIPPSAAKNNPNYDGRITQMLQLLGEGVNSDIRELIIQTSTKIPFHLGAIKRTPEELFKSYQFDKTLSLPTPKEIWIFDDILTTGSHFNAAQQLLKQYFPSVPILGFFIARAVAKGQLCHPPLTLEH